MNSFSVNNSVSPKVVAAAAGAGAGAAVSALILWIIGVAFFGGSAAADAVVATTSGVPSPIVGIIGLVLVVLGAAVPGYQTTDPVRSPATNPDVVAYQSGSGLVVAGAASPIPTGTPVDVEENSDLGVPDTSELD